MNRKNKLDEILNKIKSVGINQTTMISLEEITLQLKRKSQAGLITKLIAGKVPIITFIEGESKATFVFYQDYINYLQESVTLVKVKPKKDKTKAEQLLLAEPYSSNINSWAFCSYRRAYLFLQQKQELDKKKIEMPFFIMVCNYLAFARMVMDPNITEAGEKALQKLNLKELNVENIREYFFKQMYKDRIPNIKSEMDKLDFTHDEFIKNDTTKDKFTFLLKQEKDTFKIALIEYFNLQDQDQEKT